MKNFRKWLRAALVRAGKTVCQTAVALIPAAAMPSGRTWIGSDSGRDGGTGGSRESADVGRWAAGGGCRCDLRQSI